MKKILITSLVSLLLAGIVTVLADEWVEEGSGGRYDVKNDAVTTITLTSKAYRAVIYNTDSPTGLYAQVNVTSAVFTNNIANTKCVTIPSGEEFTFENTHVPSWEIDSILLQSEALTNSVYIGIH